jgi:DNA helicase-2/ATP-dependent DNA helicase PcrA
MLIEGIAKFLPCRILGDPLQAIFDFANQPVTWEEHIYPHYQKLGELKTPWRWQLAKSPELGQWLDSIGSRLRSNEQFSIQAPLPKGVTRIAVDLNDFTDRKRLNFLYKFLDHEDSVIAIYSGDQKSKHKAHKLAQALGGKFSSIEEVEGKDLFNFLKKLNDAKSINEKLILTIEFAKKCMTGVEGILATGTKRGEISKATKATKYPYILRVANDYLSNPTSANLMGFILAIQKAKETSTYRRDLLNRLIKILESNIETPNMTLIESANIYQRDFRHTGRPIRHNKLIGTTLLIKGLEYQHAIILEADTMTPKDLYVALTRGAKSITIVSVRKMLPS